MVTPPYSGAFGNRRDWHRALARSISNTATDCNRYALSFPSPTGYPVFNAIFWCRKFDVEIGRAYLPKKMM